MEPPWSTHESTLSDVGPAFDVEEWKKAAAEWKDVEL